MLFVAVLITTFCIKPFLLLVYIYILDRDVELEPDRPLSTLIPQTIECKKGKRSCENESSEMEWATSDTEHATLSEIEDSTDDDSESAQ